MSILCCLEVDLHDLTAETGPCPSFFAWGCLTSSGIPIQDRNDGNLSKDICPMVKRELVSQYMNKPCVKEHKLHNQAFIRLVTNTWKWQWYRSSASKLYLDMYMKTLWQSTDFYPYTLYIINCDSCSLGIPNQKQYDCDQQLMFELHVRILQFSVVSAYGDTPTMTHFGVRRSHKEY